MKPVRTEASIGIHKNSVVADEVALLSRVKGVVNTYRQPALVEEFVEGREISVGVVGNGETWRSSHPWNSCSLERHHRGSSSGVTNTMGRQQRDNDSGCLAKASL